MGSADLVPLPNSQSDIVSSVTDILKHHRSRSRWNHLRSIYPEGFRSSELIRIILSLRNRAHLALRLFSWSARLRRPDLAAHATIIHILARAGLSTRAQKILGTTLAREDEDSKPGIFETLAATYRTCDSRPFVFDLLVRTCLASGKTDRAVDIVRRLLSRGLSPTIGTCNSLLRHAARSAGADEGLRLYGEIFPHESETRTGSIRSIEPNVQTFNSLLHALYREDRVEGVERVVSEMRTRACEPNLFTYNVLMATFSDAGEIGKSAELWGQMLEKGIEPDTVSFNTLISAFCRVGEVSRAEEFYARMTIDARLEPTRHTLGSLIEGHCMVNDVEKAVQTFWDLRCRNFSPCIDSVNRIVDGLFRNKLASKALEFFREATTIETGAKPDRVSYESLIKGFCDIGRMDEAMVIQEEMASRGFEPDRRVYRYFLHGYEESGDTEKANKIREEMDASSAPG